MQAVRKFIGLALLFVVVAVGVTVYGVEKSNRSVPRTSNIVTPPEPVQKTAATHSHRKAHSSASKLVQIAKADTPVVKEAVSGDDLGKPGVQEMNFGADDRQLTRKEIMRTLDSRTRDIHRCIANVPLDEAVYGKIEFGLRIHSSGEVVAIRLTGPHIFVEGETGVCLKTVVKNVRFPVFVGSDMMLRYPIYLE